MGRVAFKKEPKMFLIFESPMKIMSRDGFSSSRLDRQVLRPLPLYWRSEHGMKGYLPMNGRKIFSSFLSLKGLDKLFLTASSRMERSNERPMERYSSDVNQGGLWTPVSSGFSPWDEGPSLLLRGRENMRWHVARFLEDFVMYLIFNSCGRRVSAISITTDGISRSRGSIEYLWYILYFRCICFKTSIAAV